jgi:hypothetical protein
MYLTQNELLYKNFYKDIKKYSTIKATNTNFIILRDMLIYLLKLKQEDTINNDQYNDLLIHICSIFIENEVNEKVNEKINQIIQDKFYSIINRVL